LLVIIFFNMNQISRLRIVIQGAVQGVGFRPFIYRLALEMKLAGWVLNSSQGVFIEVEADKPTLDRFILRIQNEKPGPAFIQSFESLFLDPVEYSGFTIKQSREEGTKSVLVLPDIATCPACLAEITDPDNRRYRYPFTNCTLCGPRYSIIQSLPYDRPQTTMARFKMCDRCRAEYENPEDRRFHAQPNACPDCGPKLTAWDEKGESLAEGHDALLLISEKLRLGAIIALKGIGGFQLMVDASNAEAVNRLRSRKRRNEKPFAVMMDSVETVKQVCQLDPFEERLLCSSEAPIVLLERKKCDGLSLVASVVAPGNPTLGVMLPYTPLHHILMSELDRPLVATSGNISDEPICIDEAEVLERLSGIADLFLVNDRPIARTIDDSVVRMVKGREMMLRRARGYAPMPVMMPHSGTNILAVGAHQKNTVALQVNQNAFVSQHIGDLENEPSVNSFEEAINSLCQLYDAKPTLMVCDQHPDYISTQFAKASGARVKQIQHHYAHICACMAENQLEGPVLGVAWDGTGYGPDQTVWGGEFLLIDQSSFKRVTHLRPFKLPGGDMAAKEPRRSALGVLYEMFADSLPSRTNLPVLDAFSDKELPVMIRLLQTGLNSPRTSSIGRLFDAVAAIIGLRQVISFEGQAAMELEFALNDKEEGHYTFQISDTVDWAPMINELLRDIGAGVETGRMAARFHNGLAEMILQVAERTGLEKVALSGGCFQNRYLTERSIRRLEESGFRPYWHQRLPPNDGGISVGQLYAAGLLEPIDL